MLSSRGTAVYRTWRFVAVKNEEYFATLAESVGCRINHALGGRLTNLHCAALCMRRSGQFAARPADGCGGRVLSKTLKQPMCARASGEVRASSALEYGLSTGLSIRDGVADEARANAEARANVGDTGLAAETRDARFGRIGNRNNFSAARCLQLAPGCAGVPDQFGSSRSGLSTSSRRRQPRRRMVGFVAQVDHDCNSPDDASVSNIIQ